jgi:tetratricopeptide (TPR) repeat protein
MVGTPIPLTAASGYSPFDATKLLLMEASSPLSQRSTTTLLLQLRSHAVEPPRQRSHPDSFFFDVWRELARRTVPVEAVLRAAVAPAIADAIVRLLTAGEAYELPEWQQAYKACAATRLQGSYQLWFRDHAAEWLSRLLDSDSTGFLSWLAPPVALLSNIPPPPIPLSDDGQWIWDRFTCHRLDDWQPMSLIAEWKFIRNGSHGQLDPRMMNALVFDPSAIGEVALGHFAGVELPNSPLARDLSADQFVHQASTLLKAGEYERAAEIFSALTVVHPADGDALNNLGFCLLPTDPQGAARVLERASSFPCTRPAMNLANRAFASHLLGDDEAALALLSQASEGTRDHPVMMWVETECGTFDLTSLSTLHEYTELLQTHIRSLNAPAAVHPTA